mmetsp:Transcript_5869/g.7404  ORF Transcript_5869/g.7404 Transcript_5869/m.7404 type:complete len:292 (-) Transcript_5869:278-1153(-)
MRSPKSLTYPHSSHAYHRPSSPPHSLNVRTPPLPQILPIDHIPHQSEKNQTSSPTAQFYNPTHPPSYPHRRERDKVGIPPPRQNPYIHPPSTTSQTAYSAPPVATPDPRQDPTDTVIPSDENRTNDTQGNNFVSCSSHSFRIRQSRPRTRTARARSCIIRVLRSICDPSTQCLEGILKTDQLLSSSLRRYLRLFLVPSPHRNLIYHKYRNFFYSNGACNWDSLYTHPILPIHNIFYLCLCNRIFVHTLHTHRRPRRHHYHIRNHRAHLGTHLGIHLGTRLTYHRQNRCVCL